MKRIFSGEYKCMYVCAKTHKIIKKNVVLNIELVVGGELSL